MVNLSIIIAAYNNQDHIIPFLKSLKASIAYLDKKTEIIIVDNKSSDQTLYLIQKFFSDINIIVNNENLGFSKAINIGIKKSSGEYILLINPDIILSENVLKETIDFLSKNPKIGVLTCKILLENGQIDLACHRGFPTPVAAIAYFLGIEKFISWSRTLSGYHLLYKPLDTIHEIDSPSGAFYLTRKPVFKKTGLLDEKFFMYGEDLDWSYRIKKIGYKIIYYPHCSIVHLKSKSGIKSHSRHVQIKTINAFYDAMGIFYRKHILRKNSGVLNKAVLGLIEVKRIWEILWLKN